MSRVFRRLPSWARHLPGKVFVAAVMVFLFSPIVVVIAFSFNSSPRMSFPFAGVSDRWYAIAFGDPLVVQAITRSAIAAVSTGLIACVLGVSAAMGLGALTSRWRAGLTGFALLPVVVPTLMIAFGLAVFYHAFSVALGLPLTISGHVLVALPFVLLTMSAALERFRFSMLEAARDLGATRFEAFVTVTLPLIRPAIEGSALLAMAVSIDEFLIAFFTAGNDTTLPMLIFARIKSGIDPSINALATALLIATTSLALLAAKRTTLRW